MLREIGARQIAEWIAFAGLEGLPESRADLRLGILASLTANVHRDAKKRPSPFKPADFIPKIKEDEARMAEHDLKSALDAISKPKRR